MILNSTLLRAAAQQIDDLDGQARELSAQKKDIFDNIKETIPPADFKAWKEAVKLRQKRVHKRDEIEAHDELVFEMLLMLEAQLVQTGQKLAVTPKISPANAHPSQEPHTRAGEAEDFDPETGEISQSPSQALIAIKPVTERDGGVDAAVAAEAANKTWATEGEVELPSAPPPEPIEVDAGTIPEFLKRVA